MNQAVGKPLFLITKSGFIVLAAWFLGFLLFANTLPEAPEVSGLESAEGIVVLTGGSGRLEMAFDLLKAQKGKRLLISGVHETVVEAELANLVKAPEALFSCCVDIDRVSTNTIGNAAATAEWVKHHQYKSIYVVTADYHMQRSQILIADAAPECEIRPIPVHSQASMQGLMMEYAKLSVTWLRSVTQL